MTVALVLLAFLLALALGAAGYCYGLYLGEKGRREAAENLLTIGTPERSQAKRIAPEPSGEEFAEQPMSEQAIKQVADGLMHLAQNEGRTIEPHTAKEEARRLLRQQFGDGEDA